MKAHSSNQKIVTTKKKKLEPQTTQKATDKRIKHGTKPKQKLRVLINSATNSHEAALRADTNDLLSSRVFVCLRGFHPSAIAKKAGFPCFSWLSRLQP